MDDKVNTSQNTEYAGPPKSHDFQSNAQMQSTTQTQSNAPEASAPRPAPRSADDVDLLTIISAPDKKEAIQPKQKKKSIKIDIKWKDIYAYRRKAHEYIKKQAKLWHAFNVLWMFLKVCFYFVGLGFFAVFLFFYFHFEAVVKNYLQQHHLENVSVERVDYSRVNDVLTITFNNVKEKSGLFTISKITLSFSFAELLNKKIQMVGIDGLRLFQNSQKPISENFESMMEIIRKSGLFGHSRWFSAELLRLDNSIMYIQTGSERLAINLAGVGNLGEKKTLVIPVNFEGKNAAGSADVQLEFTSSNDVSWIVDILSGTIDLPVVEKQNLKGKVTAKTTGGKVMFLNFEGVLSKDGLDKDVNIQLTKGQKDAFGLKSSFAIKDGVGTAVEFNIFNLNFDKNLSSFTSNSSVFLKLSNIKDSKLSFEMIQFSGTGSLYCNFEGCNYAVEKDAEIVFFSPVYRLVNTNFTVLFPIRLPLNSSKEKTLLLNDEYVDLNLSIGKTDFSARKSSLAKDPSTTVVSLKNIQFNARYNVKDKTLAGTTDINVESIVDDTIGMSDGQIKTRFTESTFYTDLTSDKAIFNGTSYFKLPSSIKASFDNDGYFVADVTALDGKLSLSANGYYYPHTGEIITAIKMNKPLVFDDKMPSLFEISELFSPDIKNLKGKVDLKGELHYSNARSIAGPLKVLLDDVSFDFGNMQIKGLTSVLNLTHLVPLGGQGTQELYISSLTTSLPFENVFAQLVFDSGRKQVNLSSLDATIAGYHLRADPMWYLYDSQSYMVSLKGKSVPLQSILDNMKISNLNIMGSGYLTLSSQILNNQFILRNLELTIPSEGIISYTPEKYTSPYLENLKSLEFKQLNAYLKEQDNIFEFVFSANNKVSKVRKKTSFRLNIKDSLNDFIKPQSNKNTIPDTIVKAKEAF